VADTDDTATAGGTKKAAPQRETGLRDLEINAERGEVSFKVTRTRTLTKDERAAPENVGKTTIEEVKSYTLKLSMSAAAGTEKRLGRTIGDLLRRAQELEFTAILNLFWTLCQKYHKAEIATLDHAGDLLDDCGGAVPFFEALKALDEINQAPPSLTTAAATGDSPDPLAAQPGADGPGAPSSLPLDA
jgi:hypothetical protein